MSSPTNSNMEQGYAKMVGLQAIFFDIDGTLFDREKAQIAFVRWIAGEMPDLFGHIEKQKLVQAFLESDRFDVSVAGQTSEQVRILRVQRTRVFLNLLKLDENFSDEITKAYVREYPRMNTPISRAKEVVEKLATKYRLGAVSNSFPDVQYRKLDTLGISRLMACVVLPHELGVEKPDPQIFLHAASLVGVDPKQSLHVGDSYASDVIGAKKAGMLACWFNPLHAPLPAGQTKPDFEIQALSEILRILLCE